MVCNIFADAKAEFFVKQLLKKLRSTNVKTDNSACMKIKLVADTTQIARNKGRHLT